tara:strand:+ start:1347 stop:2534 length:1188 start_codon:yes stop_codon:yes gene_type:complete
MRTCSKCNYPSNHPLGITFNTSNLCSGCITHNEKYEIDWSARKELFLEMLVKYKKKSKSFYDCVIPVIGDAEDYYVIQIILDLGLNPLIVNVNDYFLNDIGWHNLHNLITYFDLDSLLYNPDIKTYKELVATSLRKYNHGMWPSLSLRSAFPVHVAKQRKISLIIYGQNQPIEQIGKFSHYDEVQSSHWSRIEHDLLGINIKEMCGSGGNVDPKDISYYSYPELEKLGKGLLVGLYLNNYFLWDPLAQNYKTLNYGFKGQLQSCTFDPYERAGSSMYYGFHDLSKQLRCGYRKINDHVAREIRHKRLTTKDGLSIINQFSQRPLYIKDFFKWLNISNSGYEWFLQHRLSKLNHLISDVPISFEDDIALPDEIQSIIKPSHKAKINFQSFSKGISL